MAVAAATVATNPPFASSGDSFTQSLRRNTYAGGFYFAYDLSRGHLTHRL